MRLQHLGGPGESSWRTPGGIAVTRTTEAVDVAAVREELIASIDRRRGLLMSSGYEQSGRYSRGDLGYVDPPLEIVAWRRTLAVRALNERGRVLLPAVATALAAVLPAAAVDDQEVVAEVPEPDGLHAEEERTRRPSVFSALRRVVAAFAGPDEPYLGCYGAFGYDLIHQFESVPLRLVRDQSQRDLVLHLPDDIVTVDPYRDVALRHRYDFTVAGRTTAGLPRSTPLSVHDGPHEPDADRDHAPGEYAALVEVARDYFRRGELFEVVPSQLFSMACTGPPADIFRRLRDTNPAPYGYFANLGEGEYLVGASPEMFVRVTPQAGPDRPSLRVESCPISGTIARGRDALEDADQIKALLTSAKDESELTMCTDVDRNDKARVCLPGSVTVRDRRRIETYATLIHTVDHVQGTLRPGTDALDAFLTHVWAVTVTGAPKRAAVEFLERHERSPRRWYGGAVGRMCFDGAMDTALTLRTIHIRDGVASVRAGATLLYDSDAAAEERETELKARAQLRAIQVDAPTLRTAPVAGTPRRARPARQPRVLVVDHQDSFVHTVADYFRQVGAQVETYRSGHHVADLVAERRPDLIVLSAGPGRPADFTVEGTIAVADRLGLPLFGVCLGLQGIVEYCGGRLGRLPEPVHGKASLVRLVDGGGTLLRGLPDSFHAGRYHSLYADLPSLPADLAVTARADDGVIMAVEHRRKPMAAVQFHPESIMTAGSGYGLSVIANAVHALAARGPRRRDGDATVQKLPARQRLVANTALTELGVDP